MCAVDRQFVAQVFERLTDTRNVTVAEDRKNALQNTLWRAVDFGLLRTQVTDERLGRGQSEFVFQERSRIRWRSALAGDVSCPALAVASAQSRMIDW